MTRISKFSFFFLLIHSTLFFCACSQAFEHIPDEMADKEQISTAQTITDEYFRVLKEGGTYDFTGKAIEEFIQGFPPEVQKKSHEQVTSQFGNYESLEYAGTWLHTNGEKYTIIRFRGSFSKAGTDPEVRVVLNAENKLAGLWIMPWKDELR